MLKSFMPGYKSEKKDFLSFDHLHLAAERGTAHYCSTSWHYLVFPQELNVFGDLCLQITF